MINAFTTHHPLSLAQFVPLSLFETDLLRIVMQSLPFDLKGLVDAYEFPLELEAPSAQDTAYSNGWRRHSAWSMYHQLFRDMLTGYSENSWTSFAPPIWMTS